MGIPAGMGRRRRSSSRSVARAAFALGATVAALAVAMLGRRRLTGRAPNGVRYWSCSCGQALRTVGAGRHQVHWPADAAQDAPILEHRCPSCGKPLEAEPEHAVNAS